MKVNQIMSYEEQNALKAMGFDSVSTLLELVKGMNVSFANPLLATDVYKMGHMEQYKSGTTKVVSYLLARSDKHYSHTVFFALNYYLRIYFARKLTPEMAEEFLENRAAILGSNSEVVAKKIRALGKLGYFPIRIKAVKEGSVIPVRNVLLTLENTHPDFEWVPGFVESLILKIWDAITTASCSFNYRQVVDAAYEKSVDEELMFLKEFAVHDFGYRGCKTEEEAGTTGGAHLLSFSGSDTVPAREWLIRNYGAKRTMPFLLSVPASEHSVMCSFGREDEIEAFRNMLKLYPAGIVSIVSDTFNVYEVCAKDGFAGKLASLIHARPDGSKVVFRPDSGNPEYVICGDPSAPEGTREWKGVLRLLEEAFGSTVNKKGYKVLHAKVGIIYGDGMYLKRYLRTLERMMEELGFAASNLVIGVGGILRNHSRDTMGFALKAIYIENNGEGVPLLKDPVTDPKKKSHKGLVRLARDDEGNYFTKDECTLAEFETGLLEPVFEDGVILGETSFEAVRGRVQQALEEYKIDLEAAFAKAME